MGCHAALLASPCIQWIQILFCDQQLYINMQKHISTTRINCESSAQKDLKNLVYANSYEILNDLHEHVKWVYEMGLR